VGGRGAVFETEFHDRSGLQVDVLSTGGSALSGEGKLAAQLIAASGYRIR